MDPQLEAIRQRRMAELAQQQLSQQYGVRELLKATHAHTADACAGQGS
jgi:DNA-binding TFAR19-related protein (PDSD5 family)